MLQIINIQNEEEFLYPLCLLRIRGAPVNETEGYVKNLRDNNDNYKKYSVLNQAFNAFIFLKAGKNEIEVYCGHMTVKKIVYYKPPLHCRCVRLLYVTCRNEESFQGPDDMKRDANGAVKRIQVGALLMQTYLGETLNAEGFGRKTFQLEMNKSCFPKVFVMQLPISVQEVYKLSEEKLWENIAIQILSSPLASRSCKYLAFFCGTRYENPQKITTQNEKVILSMTKGHVSLGGGGLALVGTGAFYTWAPDISEIHRCLNSQKKIDSRYLMDFSAKRGTYGACYGTHLGSVLHELGHTFDLGHATHGIMARGFEDFHLFFTATHVSKDFSTNLQQKNILRQDMSSSLLKEPLTFTSDFVRKKSVDNISMVVQPLKDPMVSSVYSQPKATAIYQTVHQCIGSTNSPTSPGFERYEPSCLSQNVNRVEFTPKSPTPTSDMKSFFHTPFLHLKCDGTNIAANSSLNFNCIDNSDRRHVPNEKEFKCRAFWARSQALFLAYHKWITGTADTTSPALKGSVLRSACGIRAVELRDMHMAVFHHWEYLDKNPPPIIHIPWAQVPQWPPDPTIEVVAIDDKGGILKGCNIPRPL